MGVFPQRSLEGVLVGMLEDRGVFCGSMVWSVGHLDMGGRRGGGDTFRFLAVRLVGPVAPPRRFFLPKSALFIKNTASWRAGLYDARYAAQRRNLE